MLNADDNLPFDLVQQAGVERNALLLLDVRRQFDLRRLCTRNE